MDHVAGYIVVNDISARDWQGSPPALREGEKGDGQWLRAKGSDTFLPMGPVLVTADELDPAAGLRLRSWRIDGNGVEHLMQDGTTADMIWDVPALIEFISSVITLEPGDVIATGTPSGVGVFRDPPVFLEPGDWVRCEIEGIGSVENPVIDWSDEGSGARSRPCRPSSRPGTRLVSSCARSAPARRHQRRPGPRPEDRHLRHGPAHRVVGRLGPERDQAAADHRPRVRRRDRRGRCQRHRLRSGRPRQRRGSRRVRPLPALSRRPAAPVREDDRSRRRARRRLRRVRGPAR